MLNNVETCYHCGKQKTNCYHGFISMIIPHPELESKIDKWGREHYSTVMNPEYAKKHITKDKESIIDSPKIPPKYRKQYFKDNPNSRFKKRTKTQPKRK